HSVKGQILAGENMRRMCGFPRHSLHIVPHVLQDGESVDYMHVASTFSPCSLVLDSVAS
ncbi:hypothetical protein BD310DRAFT_918269, partial [Dichomitus squalens]